MRTLLCRLAITVILLGTSGLRAQDNASIGDITRKIDVEAAIPVAVLSSDAQWQRRLSTAFGAHGAYTLSPQAGAAYTIRIDPAGPSSAQLQVQQGAQTVLSRTVQGSNGTDAAMRAADLAVTQTSKLPGIFAGRLAFIGERNGSSDLYISNLFFTEPRQLTNDKANCVQPTLSPDGNFVLYTSYFRNGFPDIYRIDLNTGRRDAFLSFSGVNTGAEYSHNGSRVAVILSGTGNAEVYTVGADSKNMKRLTRNKSIESSPSWSPDNSKIVFASDASTSRPQLFQVSANGGAMTRIPTEVSGYCAEPAWNPVHDNLIAFTIAQGSEFEIALWDSTKPPARGITQGAGDAIEPCWTRDGRHLIYTERTANHRRLVLLDTKTGKKTYLHDAAWGSASQADYAYPQ